MPEQERLVPAKAAPSGGYVFLAVLVGGAVAGGGHLTVTQGVMAAVVAAVVFIALVRSKPGTPGDSLYVGTFIASDRVEALFFAAVLLAGVVAILGMLPMPAFLLDLVSPFTASPWRLGGGEGIRAASVVPEASFEWMVLGGTACLGCVWGRLYLARNPAWFARRFFYAAAIVAAVALILYATGSEPVSGLPATTTARLRGFYSNPNRFAVWLSMALIIGSAWYLDRERSARENILMTVGLGVLFAAITLTASRGTFVVFVPLAAMSIWAVSRGRFGGRRALLFMGVVPVAGLVAAAYLYPRLTILPEEIRRAEVWGATVRAAGDFPAWGSGLGTFGEVFRRYQPQHVGGFYRHAHNDYAELFLELGPAGLLLGAAFLLFVVKGWKKILRSRGSGHSPYAVAGLSAVTVAAVTSFYDFPLRQPANLLLFSVVLGMTSGRLAAYRRRRGIGEQSAKPEQSANMVSVPLFVWKWAAVALFPAALLVTAAGGMRLAALRLEPEQATGLLAFADRLEPGAGDNLKDASVASYRRWQESSQQENLAAAVSITARAAECLPYDPFLAYRAGIMAAVDGDTAVGDRLVARSVELAPAYPGLKRNAASYFFQRYVYSEGRFSVFVACMGMVLKGEPREQLWWTSRLLNAGVLDKVVRLIVGPEAAAGYIEQLFERGMWHAVVEFSGRGYALPRSVLPLRSAALVAVGREQEGIELVEGLLAPAGEKVERRLKMAARVLPDTEGEFLTAVAEKLRQNSENMCWVIKEADRRRLDTLTLVWAASYVRFREDPWGYRMLAKALGRLDRGEDARRVICDAVGRFPTDVGLWKEAVALEWSGIDGLVEYLSERHKPPSAVVDAVAGVLMVLNGRPAKAVAILEDALAGPEERGVKVEWRLKVLAQAYRRLGLNDAVDALGKLIASPAAEGSR